MKRLLVVAVVLAFAVPCLALTAQPPTPGPEVQKLAYYVGTWKIEGEVKVGSGAGKFSSTDSCEWFAGGFHLVCRAEGTGPRGKLASMAILAYDPDTKVYTVYSINSRGQTHSGKLTLTGNTLASLRDGKSAGRPAKFRQTEVQESPTSYTFKVERSVADGPWTVIEEGKATKVK